MTDEILQAMIESESQRMAYRAACLDHFFPLLVELTNTRLSFLHQ